MFILLQCLLQGLCERIMVMLIHLQEKTEKNPHHHQYHQKHQLLGIVMKNPLMHIKFVGNNRKKWDVKYIQILPAPTEGATENIGEGLH